MSVYSFLINSVRGFLFGGGSVAEISLPGLLEVPSTLTATLGLMDMVGLTVTPLKLDGTI